MPGPSLRGGPGDKNVPSKQDLQTKSWGYQLVQERWLCSGVGLELVHVDVQFTIESDGCSHGGHDLADDVVQDGLAWSLDVQLRLADGVQSFVVKNEGHISVVQEPMGGQKSVVWLDNTSSQKMRI